MRDKFGWDLPPGVTNRMIEEQARAFDEEAIEEAYISPEVSSALSERRKEDCMTIDDEIKRMHKEIYDLDRTLQGWMTTGSIVQDQINSLEKKIQADQSYLLYLRKAKAGGER